MKLWTLVLTVAMSTGPIEFESSTRIEIEPPQRVPSRTNEGDPGGCVASIVSIEVPPAVNVIVSTPPPAPVTRAPRPPSIVTTTCWPATLA